MLAVYTIVKAGDYGWGSAHTLGFGAVRGRAAGAVRLARVAAKEPLIPLRIFRSRNVAGANLVQLLMVASLFGMFFLGVLFMQHVLGYSAIGTGIAFLPVSLGIGVLSLGFSARLNSASAPRRRCWRGWHARRRVGLDGAGAGRRHVRRRPAALDAAAGSRRRDLRFPALMTLAMSGATPAESGLASGLVNTTVQVGGALGLAVLATLSSHAHGAPAGGRDVPAGGA